jgi:hypothetical protein
MASPDPRCWRSSTSCPNKIRGGYRWSPARRAFRAAGLAVLGESGGAIEAIGRSSAAAAGGDQAGSRIVGNQALSRSAVRSVAGLPSQGMAERRRNPRFSADRRLIANLTDGLAQLGPIGQAGGLPPFRPAPDLTSVARAGAAVSQNREPVSASIPCLKRFEPQNSIRPKGSGVGAARGRAEGLGQASDFARKYCRNRVGVLRHAALPWEERIRVGYAGGRAGVNRT